MLTKFSHMRKHGTSYFLEASKPVYWKLCRFSEPLYFIRTVRTIYAQVCIVLRILYKSHIYVYIHMYLLIKVGNVLRVLNRVYPTHTSTTTNFPVKILMAYLVEDLTSY